MSESFTERVGGLVFETKPVPNIAQVILVVVRLPLLIVFNLPETIYHLQEIIIRMTMPAILLSEIPVTVTTTFPRLQRATIAVHLPRRETIETILHRLLVFHVT